MPPVIYDPLDDILQFVDEDTAKQATTAMLQPGVAALVANVPLKAHADALVSAGYVVLPRRDYFLLLGAYQLCVSKGLVAPLKGSQ